MGGLCGTMILEKIPVWGEYALFGNLRAGTLAEASASAENNLPGSVPETQTGISQKYYRRKKQ